MSSRHLVVAMAWLAWSAGFLPLAGQDRAELRRTVETLAERMRETRDTLDVLDRAAEMPESLSMDGGLVFVEPRFRPRVEEAVELALLELTRDFGPTDVALLDGWRVGVGVQYSWNRFDSVEVGTWLRFDSTESARRTAGGLYDYALARLAQVGGNALMSWSNWPVVFRTQRISSYYRTAYVDLVGAPSPAGRFCLQGETTWCVKLLRLVEVDDPWRELADASDRRQLISRWTEGRFSDRRDLHRACINRGDDAACLELAADLRFPRLISSAASAALIHTAWQLGGDGALARLVADTTASLADRIASAARVPIDSVVRTWRATAMAQAPRAGSVVDTTSWVSLLVIVVLATLSLRSSRWR